VGHSLSNSTDLPSDKDTLQLMVLALLEERDQQKQHVEEQKQRAEATGVRRETAGGYLRSAGIALRTPGGWGRKAPAKAATSVTTGSDSSKPAKTSQRDHLFLLRFFQDITHASRG
jgi:hypothetical protein